MQDRRIAGSKPSPLWEDRGIFKSGVVDVRLELSPFTRRSSRGDLVCIGYIDSSEIEIVFPGRRKAETKPLEGELGRVARQTAQGKRNRLPLRARGIWRSRVIQLDDVEAKRVYQFLVSEWIIRNAAGLDTTYGEPPRT